MIHLWSSLRFWVSSLKRYHVFGKLGYYSNDTDPINVVKLLKFKLFLIHKALTNQTTQSQKEYQSIRIAIKLCDRISDGFYTLNQNKHYCKWGFPVYEYRPIALENRVQYQLVDINRYQNDVATQQIEQNELLDALRADEAHKDRDHKLLSEIITKYYNTWW
jgi:hypothetical protein